MQVLCFIALLLGNSSCGQKLVQQACPLHAEAISSSQGAIASNHHQICNLAGHQVEGSLQATLTLPEIGATRRANNSATTVDDAGNGRPVCFLDVFPSINHSLVAFLDEVDLLN